MNIFILIIKTNDFQDDLTDVQAETKSLVECSISEASLADFTVRSSARTLFICIMIKIIYRIKVSIKCSVGPLIIELLQAKKRVSTGVLYALNDLVLVQTKI